ncbi:transcriptional regulatory protein AlgP-like [Culicoides brevitarsis]|uniref:transcriptional regulatory protein AlgP-like n=1 Tax=Culicoides brevitarsis TaxID=469753 RepID=UPI00307C9539
MARNANKQVKAQKGSDLNKNSVVIQKGISRSGRAIKPKAIFGESVVELVKAKNNEKAAKTAKSKVAAKKAAEKTEKKVSEKKVAEKAQEKKVEKTSEKKVDKTSEKKVEKVTEKKVAEKKVEKSVDKKVDNKVEEKKVEKVVEKKEEKPVAKPVEKPTAKKNGPPPAKKQAVVTKVVKAPVSPMVVSPKIIQTFLPKQQSPQTPSGMPKGFTPVNISAIMAGSPIQPAKPVMAKIVCVSNQPNNSTPVNAITTHPTVTNNNSNLAKTIVLKPVQKPMTYEQREKEIQMLRARLAKLEAEQEAERKARVARQGVLKTPEVTIIRKIIQKPALPSQQQQQKIMIKPKPVVIAPAPAPTQAVSRPVVVTSVASVPPKPSVAPVLAKTSVAVPAKTSVATPVVPKTSTSSPVIVVSTNENRPARKIKPTWKAMEQD